MSTPLLTLKSSASIRDAIHLFNVHHIHGAPVMDGERLIGILTISDVARGLDDGMGMDAPITGIMTHDVVEISSATKIYDVVGRFKEREIGRLIVVEDGKPVGIVTQSDIIRVFPSV